MKNTNRRALFIKALVFASGIVVKPTGVLEAVIRGDYDYPDGLTRARMLKHPEKNSKNSERLLKVVPTSIVFPIQNGKEALFPVKMPAPTGGEFTQKELAVLTPQWEKQYKIYQMLLNEWKKKGLVNGGVKLNYGVDMLDQNKARLWGTIEDPNSPNNGAVLVPVSYKGAEYYGMGDAYVSGQEVMYLTPQTKEGSVAFAGGKWVSVEQNLDGTQKVTDYVSNKFNKWGLNVEVAEFTPDSLTVKEREMIAKWKEKISKDLKLSTDVGLFTKNGQLQLSGNPSFRVTGEVITIETKEDRIARGAIEPDKTRMILGFVGLDGKPKYLACNYGRNLVPYFEGKGGLGSGDPDFEKIPWDDRESQIKFIRDKARSFEEKGGFMPLALNLEPGVWETWDFGAIGIDPKFNDVKEYIVLERSRVNKSLRKSTNILDGKDLGQKNVPTIVSFLKEIKTTTTHEAIVLSWVGFYKKIATEYWDGKYGKDRVEEMIREGVMDRTPNIVASRILELVSGVIPNKDNIILNCSGVMFMTIPK